jgi:FkbM family methyltransferase
VTFISYAQNCEDVMLWRALKTIGAGFYIDVGAAHPDRGSVTRALYDRGWRGINIEPVPANARRLAAARARDLTLPIALGAAPGRANFFVVAIGENTELSSLDDAIGRSFAGRADVREIEVEVRTLAEICRDHVDGPIHVLKIDVGWTEQAVLEGADFARFRPWIVLVEATAPIIDGTAEHVIVETHESWEPILLDADYRFVWFDGLNRFYVAAERAEELVPHFRVPPNVLDDFLRAADGEVARRIEQAERRIVVAEALQRESAQRMQAADERGHRMALRMAREAASIAEFERMYRERTAERHQLARHVHLVTGQALDLIDQVNVLRNELTAVRTSASWRITWPMRKAVRILQRLRGQPAPPVFQPNAAPVAVPPMPESVADEPLPSTRTYLHPLREVHQFHSDSATGDAITSSMLLTQRLLRAAGYHSHIYVSNRDPALARELRLIDELPERDDYVLIVRHSIGHESMARILALPCAKVLMYHNITPPEFLDHPNLREAARLGRVQLAQMRHHVAAALADSEYNAIELRSIGFDPVRACTLLFDPADLMRPQEERDPARPFTVLFVGRIIESKGQLELIEAFAAFVRAFPQRARLVLVGRHGGEEDDYLQALRAAIRAHGLTGRVIITGAVSDAERDAWYGAAHLYVSLSQHEGFGVPLIEAMASAVPVLAWPAGAVADTLGGAGELIADPSPSAVAGRMVALAREPARRTELAEAGRRALERFAPARHMPRLIEALVRAGAALPPDPAAYASMARAMRFAIAGHVNGSYGLAAVNRTLATLIEKVHPGCVRVLPLEGTPIEDLSRVSDAERSTIARLAGRLAPVTGPEVVITQHDPVCLPPSRSDLALALVFWEESLIPADTVAKLNRFGGVLAPSRFVEDLLAESGVSRPIRLLGYAPRLDRFMALGARRERRGDDPTVFLHVSSCLPNKGIDLLLRAYTWAFRRGDAVELVIKGHPGPHNDAPAQIERLRATDPDAPPIRYIGDDLSEDALLGLYYQADAMVLPTRGEGYNVAAAEALAAGLPLIATRFGGHLDFCGSDEARLLDWTYAASRSHLATPGSVWVEPDLEDLVGALREVVQEPEASRSRAARGRCRIQKAADGGALVTRLAHIAADLLTTPPAAPLHIAWISSWGARCGVAEYSRQLLSHLVPDPDLKQVTVLADDRPPDATVAADSPGLDVQRRWVIGDPNAAQSLLAALLRADPGVTVIQHEPGLMPWPALAALLLGLHRNEPVPTVVTLHTTRHLLAIEEDERTEVVDALRLAAGIVVHTVDDLNRLKRIGIERRVVLLPHGAPAPRPPRPGRIITASDPVLIGNYGFLLPEKGIPQLIAAVGLLRRHRPGLRLRLATALHPQPQSEHELQVCRDAIATAGLDDSVELITEFLPHEKSIDLLAACDLLVMPYQSSVEASSAALATALSSGVPVAVTPLPLFDADESVVRRLPGMTPVELAEGIDALLADAPARAALAQAGHAWCAALTWDGIAMRLAGLLRQVAARPC